MILKEVGEDYHYIGFVEQWNKHVCQMLSDRNMINLALKDSSSGQIETKEASKVEKIVIPSKEINEFEADEYLTPDEPKPKKKLTAAEKNALLGDLKSFAKNFKLASS